MDVIYQAAVKRWYLLCYDVFNHNIHTPNTSGNSNIYVNIFLNEFAKRCISYIIPPLVNTTPEAIKHALFTQIIGIIWLRRIHQVILCANIYNGRENASKRVSEGIINTHYIHIIHRTICRESGNGSATCKTCKNICIRQKSMA